ncbi:hypothetical protein VDG1235_536 [Verrucomicrobiia bacterium DG1235]|nr:hypothetical protein VDG1235_536 [Verrucomicrobiae bacterium DG1235]
MTSPTRSLLIFATLAATTLSAEDGDPSIQHLFPIPEDVREILDQRCVFCHGEVIDGEAEIREDLVLSTEAGIRETLFDLDTMLELIEEDEMPYEAKLSFRLRRRPEMQQRLKDIKVAYEENGEKEKLLAWLRSKPE